MKNKFTRKAQQIRYRKYTVKQINSVTMKMNLQMKMKTKAKLHRIK